MTFRSAGAAVGRFRVFARLRAALMLRRVSSALSAWANRFDGRRPIVEEVDAALGLAVERTAYWTGRALSAEARLLAAEAREEARSRPVDPAEWAATVDRLAVAARISLQTARAEANGV